MFDGSEDLRACEALAMASVKGLGRELGALGRHRSLAHQSGLLMFQPI